MPIQPPNYTPIPNELLDRMGDMPPDEFMAKVAVYIYTYVHGVGTAEAIANHFGLDAADVEQAISELGLE